MKIKIHVITTGAYEDGHTPVDGSLTMEGYDQVNRIELPPHDIMLCGQERRHQQTAQLLRTKTGSQVCHTMRECGHDEDIFSILIDDDLMPVLNFIAMIELLRQNQMLNDVVMVTSRFHLLIMFFLTMGGEAKFGPLLNFLRIYDDLYLGGVDVPHPDLPKIKQGEMYTFELDRNAPLAAI